MAEYLTKQSCRAGIIGVLLFVSSMSVTQAENFADPTRPPASLGIVESGAVASEAQGPVLQSVLISKGRKMAVISGQSVKLGEKFGDARLVRITESEVVLKSGKDVQTLKLLPEIEKRLVNSRHRAKAVGSRQ
ncbi:hypothetical protein [Sulfurirhabdus autotrophica]|uniref:MSHA biogenesis protein MshK n=1 Tax=Sulfurirhabdus autotrophica TaxID=1706046 RepID=A0A4R3Y371_9PROT|nr:hypothetical protein [Sulfurirhabdus autotrophica]TCV84774.1 MSHA biogenesis protein MshK [Sulfurirhabdus autotrophica]